MRNDKNERLDQILGHLAGAASMCWEPKPSTQVYDPEEALKYVKEAEQAIQNLIAQETNKARLDEIKNLWSHAREHTITDIEMIMHHTGGKVDFVEAVSTDIFEKRYQALTADKEPKP